MPAGRPTKFTPENVEKILVSIRKGGSLADSAQACGIGAATAKRWLKLGRSKGEKYSRYQEFRAKYYEARSVAILSLEYVITDGAAKDPELALKVLERLRPEKWSTHRNELKRMSEELRKISDELRKARGEQ